jgi:catechol-2,3-dioxygenase
MPSDGEGAMMASNERGPRAMSGTRAIKGLGEIALQVKDLEGMTQFYAEVVGLEVLRRFPHASFFRIADGVAGHTQVLALFDRYAEDGRRQTAAGRRPPPLDHLAFGIELADLVRERERLRGLGFEVSEAVHGWVGWRSLYVDDPEGNVVEWVCYDAAILD